MAKKKCRYGTFPSLLPFSFYCPPLSPSPFPCTFSSPFHPFLSLSLCLSFPLSLLRGVGGIMVWLSLYEHSTQVHNSASKWSPWAASPSSVCSAKAVMGAPLFREVPFSPALWRSFVSPSMRGHLFPLRRASCLPWDATRVDGGGRLVFESWCTSTTQCFGPKLSSRREGRELATPC